ncbi:MAG: helicase SNF2 [Sulfurospirillum sp.]|nr:MAG: helicase SNF2 [Sulfurospirillum sp.]
MKKKADDTPILSLADIAENCEPLYFERGLDYYKKGMVASCEVASVSPKTVKIDATVYGSQDQIYTQFIMIHTMPGNRKNIVGDCSCPVAFNCKHVVAACMQAIRMQKESLTPSQKDLKAWLEKFRHKPATLPLQKNPDELLLYRLYEKRPYHDAPLTFYKTKRLKKGGFGKEYQVPDGNLFQDPYRYHYVDHEDIEILQLLKPLRHGLYPYEITFDGELGAIALQKMLATGRCFLGESNTPLQMSSDPVTPEFHWEEHTDGKKQLLSNLDPEGALLPTVPIYYIDPRTDTVHEVRTTYDTHTLSLLLHAPAVEKEDIDYFMKQAFAQIPEIDLPLPEEFACEEINTAPVPHLFLRNFTQKDGSIGHCIELSFLYADHTVPAFPRRGFLMQTEGERYLKINRDLTAEEAVIDELSTLGFRQSGNGEDCCFYSFAKPDMQTAIERWRVLLEEKVPLFRERGWQIVHEEAFDFRFTHADALSVHAEESQTHSWFDLIYEVTLHDKKIPLLPLVTTLLEEFDSPDALPPKLNLKLENGTYLHIDAKEIKPVLQTLFELFDHADADRIRIARHDAHLLGDFEDDNITWKGSRELMELNKKLRSFEGIAEVTPAPTLKATLREYQQQGLNWLNFLHEYSFSGILADDMGLGKTLQTLAFLQKLKTEGALKKPTLIVMPTSLIGNWKNEIEKFTPDLTYLALYGSDRAKLFDQAQKYDLLLTTYQLCLRDQEKFKEMEFTYIILDEAQKIKNPKAKMTQAIKSFRAEHKLALSGTPMENNLAELWSIFDFLMPGFLGNLAFFKQHYQNPVEKEHDMRRQEQLKRKIAPFMLRRTKEDVLEELPEKVEIVQKVTFGSKQAMLYENIRVTMEKKVTDVIKSKGLSRSHITILDALLKLRQICCDPALLSLSEAKKVKESAKRETLFELLEELLAEGRKILLFSQFTTMLDIIEKELQRKKIDYALLTGQTRKREEAIRKFKEDANCNLFLISLKAGGTGLNLTEADTIIHYDPWWNPAVENQATDRAHRIGQSKTVFVYKLVVENSIEEKILTLQESKKELYKGLYEKEEQEQLPLKAEDLIRLLQE